MTAVCPQVVNVLLVLCLLLLLLCQRLSHFVYKELLFLFKMCVFVCLSSFVYYSKCHGLIHYYYWENHRDATSTALVYLVSLYRSVSSVQIEICTSTFISADPESFVNEGQNLTVSTTNESQEVSSFPAGDHKAHINRRAQRHNKHKTEQKHKRSTKEVPPWNSQ